MRILKDNPKLAVVIAVPVVQIAVALSFSPYPQPLEYHDFADKRPWLGIANFADVTSNLAFVIAAALGLAFVTGQQATTTFVEPLVRWPFLVFFAGVALVSVGSAYYHLDPNNGTLVWDRLPMTVAFMASLAGFIADRIHARAGTLIFLPLLLCVGAASVVYWHATESAGHGDLRFYFLVQAFAIILIPLICLLFPGRHTHGRYVVYMLLWYGGAVACEQLDDEIYKALGHTLSGHTIKHVLAAVAIAMVALMLWRTSSLRESLDERGR